MRPAQRNRRHSSCSTGRLSTLHPGHALVVESPTCSSKAPCWSSWSSTEQLCACNRSGRGFSPTSIRASPHRKPLEQASWSLEANLPADVLWALHVATICRRFTRQAYGPLIAGVAVSSHSDSVNSVITPTGHARKPRSPKSRAKHEVFLCLANISAQKAATRAERDLSNLLRADRKEVVKRKVQSRKNYARADRATAHEHAAHLEQVHQLEDLKSVKTTSHQIHSMQVDDAGLSDRERAKAPWPQQRILAERSTRAALTQTLFR